MSHSAETRAKISAAHMGMKHTPESIAKMRAAQSGRKRRPHSPETIAKMRAAKLGHAVSVETRAKLRARLAGVPRPDNRERNLGNRHVLDAPVKGECVYCLGPATTFDHVIPRRRGGLDVPENVVPCCRSCNSAKHDRTPEEWWAFLTGE